LQATNYKLTTTKNENFDEKPDCGSGGADFSVGWVRRQRHVTSTGTSGASQPTAHSPTVTIIDFLLQLIFKQHSTDSQCFSMGQTTLKIAPSRGRISTHI